MKFHPKMRLTAKHVLDVSIYSKNTFFLQKTADVIQNLSNVFYQIIFFGKRRRLR